MYTILLILHVLTAALFLGPVTVAVSSFQVHATKARDNDPQATGMANLMHRITSSYGVLSLLVPLLGVAVMFTDPGTYWKNGLFHAALLLALLAWALLLFLIIPRQKKMMAALGLAEDDEAPEGDAHIADWDKAKGQLSMFGGIFALLWVMILVLMFL
ncbi:DUF2269 domain-containing protein [Corynebacterium sp. zg-331]|uniref:DUF2269 domain-containing protein n=1 Tax=unclassified Corynebacterium TaxID=2624378 RepID=UPI00128B0878|nr:MULTISPECIES: DUF2269 domain-containing protein [unclassified Corynebacterium]MBC3186175.1 DUF2269 domain-containing protein [Corynebacterium sp. zg-331]MPV52663.1 DUF2269 domain-containing protein [Corynebacterium sp. zg331]